MARTEVGEGEIRRMAQLARLKLSDGEVAALAREASRILEAVRDLAEVPLEGVEPTFGAGMEGDVLRLRADLPQPGLSPEEALAASAGARQGLFRAGGVGVERTVHA